MSKKYQVTERRYNGRAVKYGDDQRYHCLHYPCKNLTRWFYLPMNSHECLTHIRMFERRIDRNEHLLGTRK